MDDAGSEASHGTDHSLRHRILRCITEGSKLIEVQVDVLHSLLQKRHNSGATDCIKAVLSLLQTKRGNALRWLSQVQETNVSPAKIRAETQQIVEADLSSKKDICNKLRCIGCENLIDYDVLRYWGSPVNMEDFIASILTFNDSSDAPPPR